MGIINLAPYKPVPATVGDANAIANAMTTLEGVINGGIDNNNFAAGKIFDPAKLMQNGAVEGALVAWDLASATWKPRGATYRKTTAKTVVSTVAATDLLNGEITIAAAVMGAAGMIRLSAGGDRLQFSGGGAALPRFQLVFGGATLLDTGTPGGLEGSVNIRVHWHLEAFILNTATNAQIAWLFLSVTSQGGIAGGTAGFVTGLGTYQNLYTGGTSVMAQAAGVGTGAVDTTAAKALVLNVINGSASASYETKLLGALVEVI